MNNIHTIREYVDKFRIKIIGFISETCQRILLLCIVHSLSEYPIICFLFFVFFNSLHSVINLFIIIHHVILTITPFHNYCIYPPPPDVTKNNNRVLKKAWFNSISYFPSQCYYIFFNIEFVKFEITFILCC